MKKYLLGATAVLGAVLMMGAYIQFSPPYSATTVSLGGGLLAALGTCTTVVTTSVSYVTTAMAVVSTPNSPDSNYGGLWNVDSWVSSAGVVSTKLCAVAAVTPSATTINLRIVP